jgi:hypothetical protein
MASARWIAWTERLAWILIYAGLFIVVIGLATLERHLAAGWSMIGAGSVLTIGGVVLIWVRSRLRQD